MFFYFFFYFSWRQQIWFIDLKSNIILQFDSDNYIEMYFTILYYIYNDHKSMTAQIFVLIFSGAEC